MGLLPLVMHVCGCTVRRVLDVPCGDASAGSCGKHENQSNNSLSRTRKEPSHAHWKTFILVCLISVNLPIALYTCLIHQRGTIDVTTFLYAEAQKPASKDLMSVLFLMPCHSTPFYRYLSSVWCSVNTWTEASPKLLRPPACILDPVSLHALVSKSHQFYIYFHNFCARLLRQ